jgi:hypothetical protein
MRRSHDKLKAPALSVDRTSGETHLRRAAEIHLAAEDRVRQRAERQAEIEQRLHPQQIGHLRLLEPQGHQRRGEKLRQREAAIEQDQHP